MNAQSTDLAVRNDTPIDKLKTNLSSRADEFKVALPAHISFDKFQRTIATAAMSNPDLLTCDRRSLLLASMKLAQDGLLPDGREAALVPFKRSFKDGGEWKSVWEVQPMPMAWGLRKKILQSGMVVSLETGLVYRAEVESGHFIYEIGMDPPIRHRPNLALTDEQMDDGEIVAAYSIARIKSEHGDPYWSVEVMRRAEINKVRESSQTGATKDRNGKPRTPRGPWVDWFGEMARKTVLRRHSKVLPMSGDVLETIEREDEHLAAHGAARLLETEEAAPLRLPTADELDEGETVNEETGEFTTDARGMSEVDEETARKLDAGQSEPEAEAEQVDEEGRDAGAAEDDADETPSQVKLKEIRGGINAAKNAKYLDTVDGDWIKARAAYNDETAAEIDGLIAAKRRAFAEGKGK
jgi:recombination protein RecT